MGQTEDVTADDSALFAKGHGLPSMSDAVSTPTAHEPDVRGHYGVFGGRYVPEALMAVIEEVTAAYEKERTDPGFLAELDRLQRDYTGRPSPVFEATRLSEHAGGARILLKREDLNHTGSHKINNVLGQVLLAATASYLVNIVLVGAVMIQRPELFGAVLCRVPVADMLRYHLASANARLPR